FLLRQFYISLPDEMEEAALVDGAGYWTIYRRIVLPLSRPILAALAVFFFLANWNSFVWPMTITSNPDLRVVQLAIPPVQQQYAAGWKDLLAAAPVASLPTLAFFFVFQTQIVASIKTPGLKRAPAYGRRSRRSEPEDPGGRAPEDAFGHVELPEIRL